MISTEVVSIGDLFSSSVFGDSPELAKFSIPPIQRGYQWGVGVQNKPEVDRSAYILLKDLLNYHQSPSREEMPYYCGTIIVYVDQHGDEDTFQLMDGQQRWTSYTALMGAIFHLLDNGNDGSNWDEIKSDIATRFLKTTDNQNRLQSSRSADNEILNLLTNFSGHIQLDDQFNFESENVQYEVFRMDDITYRGSKLQCVAMHYVHTLKQEFQIEGPLSPRGSLVEFYEGIRDNVVVNLTLAPSAVVAHEMFITANTRGTPLNSFDVMRGFLISRDMTLNLNLGTRLQTKIENCETWLDRYIDEVKVGNEDNNKLINEIMQEIMSVFVGRRVSKSEIMFYIRNHIENLSSGEEIFAFVDYFKRYITASMRIQRKNWVDCHFIGLEENLRLRYMGFSQHRMLYCSMLVSHGQSGHSSETEEHLLAILRGFECLCFRTIASFIQFPVFTRKCYSFIPRQANLVKERGLTNDLVEELLNEYANLDENPESLEYVGIFERVKNPNDVNPKKMVSMFYALENIVDGPIGSGEGSNASRKIGALLPVYNHRDVDAAQVWDYGVERRGDSFASQQIGNLFLLSLNGSQIKQMNTTNKQERIQQFRQNSAGMVETGTPYLDVADWSELQITARNAQLLAAIESRFPRNCRVNIIE